MTSARLVGVMTPKLSLEEFVNKYCDAQICEHSELEGTLRAQHETRDPDGWMILQCQDLSSSYMGSLTILPYGPRNTYQAPPTHPISPRGLASDMSTVLALLDNPFRGVTV